MQTSPSFADELRRQRQAVGMSLQTLSRRTDLSVGFLSRLERGERQPSLPVLVKVRSALGLTAPLPEDILAPAVSSETLDDLLPRLGALIGSARELDLGELAKYLSLPIGSVRLGLRQLSNSLRPFGLVVLDDGSKVCLAAAPEMAEVVAEMVGTMDVPLGQAHLEILAIVVWHGQVTRRRIEQIRGVNCVDSLAWLVEHGLLTRDRDKETLGHANVYRITNHALQLAGVTSIDDLKRRMRTSMQQQSEEQGGIQGRHTDEYGRPTISL